MHRIVEFFFLFHGMELIRFIYIKTVFNYNFIQHSQTGRDSSNDEIESKFCTYI